MNKDQLARLEERIEQLIEGSFARLVDNRLQPREVAMRLARAVEDNVRPDPSGGLIAPNAYVVSLHPDDLKALQKTAPDLAQRLSEAVLDLANRAELRLEKIPRVELRADSSIGLRDIRISARHEAELRSTQILTPLSSQKEQVRQPEQTSLGRNPQLILYGHEYVPLDRSVINLGRKRDNFIAIDDPRISRRHAQIRLRFGRYVIYDLGSTGGTYVNNHRITECILHPGDVISLAGVTLVYMEDESAIREENVGDTQLHPKYKLDASGEHDHENDPTV